MTGIYDQHKAAFARVSAFVICRNGERVATIALKFPADGAGRLYAYVHWIGVPMVRGFSGGYGYDKRSAAIAEAARRINADVKPHDTATDDKHRFIGALEKDDGEYWDTRLRLAGFEVLQAV